MDHTAAGTMALATIPPPEPMRAAVRFQHPTDARRPDRHTTLTQGPTALRVRPRTLTEAPGVQFIPGMARPHTPNTRRPRMGRWDRYRPQQAAEVLPEQA